MIRNQRKCSAFVDCSDVPVNMNLSRLSKSSQNKFSDQLFDSEVCAPRKSSQKQSQSRFDVSKSNEQKRKNELQQECLRENIEIVGLPNIKKKNLKHILKRIAEIINIGFEETDIVSVFINDKKNIIVEFHTQCKKSEWMAAAKKKGSLNAQEVDQSFPVSKVRIRDHLSPQYKYLYSRAIEMKNNKILFSVLIENSMIFVKKSATSSAKSIKSANDLDALL